MLAGRGEGTEGNCSSHVAYTISLTLSAVILSIQGPSSLSLSMLQCCQHILCLSSDSVLKTTGLGQWMSAEGMAEHGSTPEEADGSQQPRFPVRVES